MKNIQVAVHHPGARHSYGIPLTLKNYDLLYKLFTDVYCPKWLISAAKTSDLITQNRWNLSDKFSRRFNSNLLDSEVKDLGLMGWVDNFSLRNLSNDLEMFEFNFMISKKIAQTMSQYSQKFSHIYCYAFSASDCRVCMKDKIIIMDQMHTPIKSFMPIIKAEINKHSEWLSKSTNIYDICKQSLIFKEKQDIDSIDFILAPSQFIRDCLVNDLDIAHEIISLIPYPIPAWLYNYKTAASSASSLPLSEKFEEDKLKILFVGEVGIRKGIPYLLKALRKISPHKFEMRIVGSLEIHPHKVQEYSDICTFLGRLDKKGLAEQYQWANLFVFPSLAEGSAGVVNEALAFGLPVITTQSSGSNVRDGIEGRIVTEGSVEELVACIEKYFEQRSLLLNHARNAWNRAKEFTLEKTSQKLSEFFVQRST